MKKMVAIATSVMAVIIVGMLFINGKQTNTEVTRNRTKVGFLYNGTIDDKGWGQSHHEGISKSAKELNLEILYEEKVPYDERCMEVMKQMVEEGCKIIICNSYDYGKWMLRVAEEYPDVVFYHATGVEERNNVSTYFGRMYQMRYLSGIVAGLQTENDSIGYVAAFPISEVNRGINAFTLGVRKVNPKAEVHVVWSESWIGVEENSEAASELIEAYDVDVMAMHCDSVAPLEVAEAKKIWSIGYNMDNSKCYPDSFLTAAVWNWEKFYTPQILTCLQGKFHAEHHWDGVETDLVGLSPFTKNVKQGIAEVVEREKKRLYEGDFDVFNGPVSDADGKIRIRNGENMPDEAMLNAFDWYVEGVKMHGK